jgi:hypothetical protein
MKLLGKRNSYYELQETFQENFQENFQIFTVKILKSYT